MEFEVTEVARALGLVDSQARVIVGSDARVTGWSIDSRSIAPGDLFFALRGPNHDGNAYVDEVLRRGAVAAVANEELCPELTFEITDLIGEGRSGNVQSRCGTAEMELLRNGDEVGELPKFHAIASYLCASDRVPLISGSRQPSDLGDKSWTLDEDKR